MTNANKTIKDCKKKMTVRFRLVLNSQKQKW